MESGAGVLRGLGLVELLAWQSASPPNIAHELQIGAGENGYGKIGDGTTTSQFTPAPVVGGHVFIDIAVGFDFSCGLKAEGAVFCWGDDEYGSLGDNTTTWDQSTTPVAVVGGHNFTQIGAGLWVTMGLKDAPLLHAPAVAPPPSPLPPPHPPVSAPAEVEQPSSRAFDVCTLRARAMPVLELRHAIFSAICIQWSLMTAGHCRAAAKPLTSLAGSAFPCSPVPHPPFPIPAVAVASFATAAKPSGVCSLVLGGLPRVLLPFALSGRDMPPSPWQTLECCVMGDRCADLHAMV